VAAVGLPTPAIDGVQLEIAERLRAVDVDPATAKASTALLAGLDEESKGLATLAQPEVR